MLSRVLPRHSLKTRITVAMLLIFLVSLWALSFYATRMLKSDMEGLLGEQQFATVSYVASEVDGKLEERLQALELNSRAIDSALLGSPAALHVFLDQRHFLRSLFNAGVSVYGVTGEVLAATPLARVVPAADRDAVASALNDDRSAVGLPRLGKGVGDRSFSMAAPIHDGAGRVIGALSGNVNLDQPNFLDKVTASHYGKTGGYVVLAPKKRLIVTATDKSRIMENLPEVGVNPTLDGFLDGFEGSAVYTTPRGVLVLGSAKAIPVAGWLMGGTIPAAEAFAPIRAMQQRMWLATVLLALLAGGLSWWLLKRELSPLLATAKALSDFSASSERPPVLPIRRGDEIGLLIDRFNQLFGTLGKRNAELQQTAHLLNEAQSVAGIGSYSLDLALRRWTSSAVLDQEFGIDESFEHSTEAWLTIVHPDDRATVAEYFSNEVIGQSRPFDRVYRIVRPSDRAVRWVHGLGKLEFDDENRPVLMHGTIQDITERRFAEAALRESHETLTSILATTKDGFWRVDRQGRLIDANPAYSQLSGYRHDELVGRHIATFETATAAEIAAHIARVIESGGEQFEAVHRRQDGSLWNVEVSAIFEDTHGGELFTFLRDITERKAAEAELEQHRYHLEELVASRTFELAQAKEAAEAANRAKSTFLANMSHEIRTPLNGVIGMTHILMRGVVTGVQAERLDKIDTAAKHLLSTINDILDLSKIEAGKVILEDVPFAIADLLANVKSIVDSRAQAKGIALDIASGDHWPELRGDPTRLQQALLNYVGNAIKFTENGGVRVRVVNQGEGDDFLQLCFEVEDTGIGIPAEARPRLFSAFEQAANSTTRKYGGTGLGLAITRRLAELMGGQAGVKSVVGVGSTFWFTAQFLKNKSQSGADPAIRGQAEKVLRERHRGGRILLVDDDPMNLEVATLLLEDVGLVVETAGDGVQAVEQVQGKRYAAVLMDMHMPNLDGVQATQQIRALSCARTIPILAMTANAFAEDKACCLAAGMNDFLAKPFNPDVLFSTLLKWLERGCDPLAIDRSLLIGVASVDQEHRELIAQLDRLADDADADPLSERFSQILSHLGEQISAHFTHEEIYVKSLGMPEDLIVSHVEAHGEILEQYNRLNFDLMRGEGIDRVVVLAMIRSWLIDHIVLHDLEIRGYRATHELVEP